MVLTGEFLHQSRGFFSDEAAASSKRHSRNELSTNERETIEGELVELFEEITSIASETLNQPQNTKHADITLPLTPS